MWGEIIRVADLKYFKDFDKDFVKDIDRWQEIYDSSRPHLESYPFVFSPGIRGELQQLILLRVIRPDKVIPGIIEFIKDYLGKKFADPPPSRLD